MLDGEDQLNDPKAILYNKEIHYALKSHTDSLSHEQCPANAWMKEQLNTSSHQYSQLITPLRYHWSDGNICHVLNWIFGNAERAKKRVDSWLSKNQVLVNHASTLLLAFCL